MFSKKFWGDESGAASLEQSLSRITLLLSNSDTLDDLCRTLYDGGAGGRTGGITREGLWDLTQLVIDGCPARDPAALQELLHMLSSPRTNCESERDGAGALAYGPFVCYARCVLRVLEAALQAELQSTCDGQHFERNPRQTAEKAVVEPTPEFVVPAAMTPWASRSDMQVAMASAILRSPAALERDVLVLTAEDLRAAGMEISLATACSCPRHDQTEHRPASGAGGAASEGAECVPAVGCPRPALQVCATGASKQHHHPPPSLLNNSRSHSTGSLRTCRPHSFHASTGTPGRPAVERAMGARGSSRKPGMLFDAFDILPPPSNCLSSARTSSLGSLTSRRPILRVPMSQAETHCSASSSSRATSCGAWSDTIGAQPLVVPPPKAFRFEQPRNPRRADVRASAKDRRDVSPGVALQPLDRNSPRSVVPQVGHAVNVECMHVDRVAGCFSVPGSAHLGNAPPNTGGASRCASAAQARVIMVRSRSPSPTWNDQSACVGGAQATGSRAACAKDSGISHRLISGGPATAPQSCGRYAVVQGTGDAFVGMPPECASLPSLVVQPLLASVGTCATPSRPWHASAPSNASGGTSAHSSCPCESRTVGTLILRSLAVGPQEQRPCRDQGVGGVPARSLSPAAKTSGSPSFVGLTAAPTAATRRAGVVLPMERRAGQCVTSAFRPRGCSHVGESFPPQFVQGTCTRANVNGADLATTDGVAIVENCPEQPPTCITSSATVPAGCAAPLERTHPANDLLRLHLCRREVELQLMQQRLARLGDECDGLQRTRVARPGTSIGHSPADLAGA